MFPLALSRHLKYVNRRMLYNLFDVVYSRLTL
jgi:hypothetical protein